MLSKLERLTEFYRVNFGEFPANQQDEFATDQWERFLAAIPDEKLEELTEQVGLILKDRHAKPRLHEYRRAWSAIRPAPKPAEERAPEDRCGLCRDSGLMSYYYTRFPDENGRKIHRLGIHEGGHAYRACVCCLCTHGERMMERRTEYRVSHHRRRQIADWIVANPDPLPEVRRVNRMQTPPWIVERLAAMRAKP